MVSLRALFGTALGLTVAGCATSGGDGTIPAFALGADLPAAQTAAANRTAASSIMGSAPAPAMRVASLQPVAGEVPLVTKGTVLWHRVEAPPPPAAAQAAAAPAQPAVTRQIEQLNAQLATLKAQQQAIKDQTLQAVTSMAQIGQQTMQANAQIESRLQNFAELKAVQESRRAAAAAKVFTAEQLARANANTAQVLAQTYQKAGQRAEQIAAAKTGPLATRLAELEQTSVKPAQVKAIALQSVKDSKDYIKTVTRNTVQDDSDPAIAKAFSIAASNVITKNDKVVFAIRRAIAEELQAAAATAAAPKVTRLGPDHHDGLATPQDIQLDAGHLKIGRLLAPQGGPAPDASITPPTLAAISPAAGGAPVATAMLAAPSAGKASLGRPHARTSWMDIRRYKVVVHQDNRTLEQLLADVVTAAEPFTGPWEVKWKLSKENKGLLHEKFSLDAETDFDEFLSYISQYIMNDRGVKLSFSLFDSERIIVISD